VGHQRTRGVVSGGHAGRERDQQPEETDLQRGGTAPGQAGDVEVGAGYADQEQDAELSDGVEQVLLRRAGGEQPAVHGRCRVAEQ